MQDYYNLVDVYIDAVLQPRCVTDPKTFAQEGWHYELDDPKVGFKLVLPCTVLHCIELDCNSLHYSACTECCVQLYIGYWLS